MLTIFRPGMREKRVQDQIKLSSVYTDIKIVLYTAHALFHHDLHGNFHTGECTQADTGAAFMNISIEPPAKC